jgi:3-oxoacyl-[acyl-carrier protein] reductase
MNKVALITGASGGIGTSIAKELASNNYDLIIHYYKNEESINDLENWIKTNTNVNYLKIKCDLKEEKEIDEMINKSLDKFGKIDILINNASIEITSELKDKTKEDFINVLNVNLLSTFLLSKKIGSLMFDNKYGKIINITSNNAINKYDPSTLEYDASKAGIISLTHNFAVSFAPYVNVNAIAPGWIMTKKVSELNKSLDGMLESEEKNNILVGRFGKVEEIAYLVDFLCSDKANYINNQIITIDGGTK